MLPLTRRFLIAGGCGLLAAGALTPRAARATVIPPANAMPFLIRRDGDRIGQHTFAFQQDGTDTIVDIQIDMEVFFGPIRVFYYTHRNREVWRDGRLVSLNTQTDHDGDTYTVQGTAVTDGFQVTGADGTAVLPADIMSTSYWRQESMAQSQLLNTQNGRVMDVAITALGADTITAAGQTITADRYNVSGDLDLNVWYAPTGQFVKLSFVASDSQIDYELIDVGGGRSLAAL